MIGFQHQQVGSLNSRLNIRRDKSKIRCQRHALRTLYSIPNRISRIMRRRKRHHRHPRQFEPWIHRTNTFWGKLCTTAHVLKRRSPRENWQVIPLRQCRQSRNMIAMLMGNQHAIKTSRINALCQKCLLDSRCANPCIQQQSAPIHFHIDGISLTATGQHRNLHIPANSYPNRWFWKPSAKNPVPKHRAQNLLYTFPITLSCTGTTFAPKHA